MKYFLYYIQNIFLGFIFFIFSHLPLRSASWIGGTVCRFIGPYLRLSKIAYRNLQIAFPDQKQKWRRDTLYKAWENLGRTFAEFPHLHEISSHHSSEVGWRVIGETYLYEALASRRPVIFFSGHMGNWELLPVIVAHYGMVFSPFYRKPNNPFLDRKLRCLREKAIGQKVDMFPKGSKGARQAIKHLGAGGYLGILGDQKMNDGIETLFFNHPAMTAPAAASLALRYKALIVTGHIWREGPTRFVLKVAPPIDPVLSTNSPKPQEIIEKLTQNLNDQLQSWIEQHPSQWLWFHRRWEKKLYKN